MSTVTEIKQAVSKLPARKRRELVRWMQTQVGEDERDDSTRAGTIRRNASAEARRFLGDLDRAVKVIAKGPRPAGSIVATLSKMRR